MFRLFLVELQYLSTVLNSSQFTVEISVFLLKRPPSPRVSEETATSGLLEFYFHLRYDRCGSCVSPWLNFSNATVPFTFAYLLLKRTPV